MIRRLTIIVFAVLINIWVLSQDENINDEPALKTQTHSISVRTFLGFDYTYSYSFSRYFNLGISLGLGLGGSYLLYHPDYEYKSSPTYTKSPFSSSSSKMNFQLLHLSAFYRSYIFNEFYTDLGFYSSMGYIFPSDNEVAFERFFGVFLAIYYGFEKIKFGHELQIGKMDIQFYYETKSNPSIQITPIIVRFQL